MNELMVHVIDDDEGAREALAFLLEASDFRVTSYVSAMAFLDILETAEPGIVVSDIRMPEMTGLELAQRMRTLSAGFPIIIITGHGDIPMAVEAMRSGVVDFLEKPFAEERMLSALGRAAAILRPPDEPFDQDAAELTERLQSLSDRERQVLDRVVSGQANKVIARDLGISPRTVEIYRAKVMGKMQADSLAGLVRMAMSAERAGLGASSVQTLAGD
jgi:two-component system response regulator FixJ